MEIFYIIAAALAPVAVLFYYINRKDRSNQEPAKELLKAFGLGILSIFVSLTISLPLGALGLFVNDPSTFLGGAATAFFGAAIPEEIAKFLMFWVLVRRSRHFDEHMDGIVYASCVSLGFAALENVMYLFSNYDAWVSVGISRAIFSVPGHFFFGILMGYYFSIVRFGASRSAKAKCMVLLAPILAHGAFDAFLFSMDLLPSVSLVLAAIFLYGVNKLRKIAVDKAEQHLKTDSVTIDY